MTNESRDLVVVVTHGIDHELSSAALTIALGGTTAGLKVSLFLTSAGVKDFLGRGGVIWACPPCTKSRGYAQESLIDGVVIAGAAKMHERIQAGAATLSF